MNAIIMALDSIREKKGRSFLTMLGIIIGVTAVLVLVALVSGYNADITAYYEKLGVNKVTVDLTWYDTTRAEDVGTLLYEYGNGELSDMVTGVSPSLSTSKTVKHGGSTAEGVTVYFGSDQFAACNNYTLDTGRDILSYDIENRSQVCVLGSYVADTLFEYADPIGQTVYLNGDPFLVVGTYYQKDGGEEDSMDNMLVVPSSLTRSLLTSDYITSYTVKVDTSDQVDTVIDKLDSYLSENISSGVGTYTLTDGNAAMTESTEETTSMSVVLGGIAGIALLVGGIGIMNIMLVTVTERTREIGIKKSIGAPRREIVTQFLVEAAILSGLGGLIGIGLGFVLSAVLGKLMYDLILFPNALIALGAAVLAALLCAGLVPSASVAFTDVTDPEVAQAVEVLSGLGIVSGDGTGAYYPDSGLTRSQFCKLIVLTEGHGDSVASSAYKTLFSDVPASRWDAPYVNLAYSEGLVAGYGNGSFGPDDGVTVSQAVTIALRLLGYTDADIGPFWPEDYLSRAEELGLLEGISSDGNHLLTRGEAAVLLYTLLTMDTTQGRPLYEGLASQTVTSALLTGVDVIADDGTAHTVEVWTASGGVKHYSYVNALSEELIGTRGTLLLNESGKAVGFIPDETATRTVTLASVDGSGLTDGDGNTFTIANSVSVLLKGETLTWSDSWYDLRSGDTVVLCYSAAGSIEALWVKERETAAGTVLTGWYENASPNTAAPDTITVLGAQLSVAEEGLDSLRDFSIGDKISVTLNGDGEVIAAEAASSGAPVMAGILTSGNNSTVSVALSSGVTVSGELYSGSISALSGSLVQVTSPAKGKLSVSALGTSSVSGSLDVAAGTLGELALSPDVTIYDQVEGNGVVEVSLSDILVDTVPASSIAYVSTDSAGQVNLLVLEDVTGSCYTYGFLEKGEQTGGSGTMQYTNTTVTVDNGENNTAYITGMSFTDGAVGGVVGTGEGKVASLVVLTAVEDLTRADFDGSDSVAGIPIASDVKVYNAVTETWVTLSQAKAFTDTFTAYYDREPEQGGQIRVIVAGE